MASITVWNVPDEVHRALRVLAARHGRSVEAEIRDILERDVMPAKRARLGDGLAALGLEVGITNDAAQSAALPPCGGRTIPHQPSDRMLAPRQDDFLATLDTAQQLRQVGPGHMNGHCLSILTK
jgi:plasmid stability protein